MTATQQTTISTDGDLITLINVFTCPEERQDELVAALDKATSEIFVRQPGFISANIHASLDHTRVVNYVQWARVEDFDATGSVPEVQEHMAQILAIASSADPRLFRVRAVYHP
jgi:antibiotic biosynthesis monooxygenase